MDYRLVLDAHKYFFNRRPHFESQGRIWYFLKHVKTYVQHRLTQLENRAH
jgi:hypothetical protein